MDLPFIVVAVYGLFSLVGGFIGFAKAGSKASLIAGGVSGLILLVCAWGISRGEMLAEIVSLIIAVLLGGRFLGTWFKTKRLMPDLLMIILSLLTLVVVGLEFF